MKPENHIPYGRQSVDEDDIKSVIPVLGSPWLTQGPKVREFEEAIANYCGARYAVATSNGTAGLHIACLAAGLRDGFEAVTSPVTFVGTSNAVIYTGATPVFSDIDYKTVNIASDSIKEQITKRTKVVLPVHFAGLPADSEEIYRIAKSKNITVITDSCHALGGSYQGKAIGSCRYSDMEVFSFHPVKPITTGEGGCVLTNDSKLYKHLKALASHGIFRTPEISKRLGPWAYEMQLLGFNFRITDFQCALGLSQLKKLDRFIGKRHQIAVRYGKILKRLGENVILPETKYPDRSHAWHLYLFRLVKNQKGVLRRKLYERLRQKGIMLQVHYIPIYRQPFYQQNILNGRKPNCPNAEKYYNETLSLPIFPDLPLREVDRIGELIIREVERMKFS